MAIREDLVASAAQFLQDPSVASSPVEKKVAFLQAKNLTQEEINAALGRVGAPAQAYTPQTAPAGAQPPQYYGQYPPQYPPYGWQQPPPQTVPRRDWRDWFIMATVVSGVSYGLFSLGKRYVYPLIAPPTPERLEQDKKSIDEQFEKTFTLVDQLAKDTETLKASEKERTERLDTALNELETVINDLKVANKQQDGKAQRLQDDVGGLKDSISRGLANQKDLTDTRLREVNAELKSLKTLITQRMNPTATSNSVSNYLRPGANGNVTLTSPAVTPAPAAENAVAEPKEEPKPANQDFLSGANRSSPFSSGMQSKAIPAWQMMAAKSAGSPGSPVVNGVDAGSSTETQEASGSV
ncbi:peroxisomal membrane anchor protein conserved region-domain-containing protein [Chaetomidium leptoderma]|uniref:Peroxisomal membrane protein PEX14 n=1 Tax=Chaetomidium leptoderma TaxID=669021 RepID=A0AAN6ZY16_9PEZI|nr:peroxisomal membrane anchor protein conserved region-domain-containing protein [Chaetomidium leptoderma]